MTLFYVIVSIIIGLIVLGGLFYVSYLVESLKQRQALLIAKAYDRIQKYQRYLDCFEADVLPKEIRLVLIEEILYHIRNILKINDEDPKAQRLLMYAEEQHRDILGSGNKPPKVPKVKDAASAKEIQLQFKNLFRLLHYIGQTRKHHRKVLNRNMKILQSLFVETGVSLHRSTAEQALNQDKVKLALHHFNQAIGEYSRVDSKKFGPQIKELRAKIAVHRNNSIKKSKNPSLLNKLKRMKRNQVAAWIVSLINRLQ